jgi:hypothetical protein
MTIAWFICGFKQKPGIKPGGSPIRYCAMDDFTAQIINVDGGNWSESEVLGGYAVVKVNAADATLTTINGTNGFFRIPTWVNLTDSLANMTSGQRTTLLTWIGNMGYTPAEISAALGGNLSGWRTKTLGDLLRFCAQRRLTPRWDDVQLQIVLDGALVPCRPIAEVDTSVQ